MVFPICHAYHADMRICFIGDSYVTGTGDETCQGWVGRLCATERQAGHDITPYNLGVRGQTGRDIALRWHAETRPRLEGRHDGGIVLSFGVNDCTSTTHGQPRIPHDESIATTRQILQQARQTWPVLMIGPPPVGRPCPDDRTRALSHAMAELCARLSVPFLPVWEPLLAHPAWCAEIARGDGAHPAGGGYTALARIIHDWSAWREWMEPLP
ncbi:lipolytic protein G-D-S-L [Komagataeibacter diospyri]|nr:GDSL-type esterase/lipase family protein [Komagataeibacter diospyri]GCE90747.1 lipolytic protein G-D-S-L [Komagataeibacter diospyri]